MSNNDMIRRGDAKLCLIDWWFHAPMFHQKAERAIAALPAADPMADPRVQVLVQAAFFEGFTEGYCGTWVEGDPSHAWRDSEVRATLAEIEGEKE
jgi:hypothetical protein